MPLDKIFVLDALLKYNYLPNQKRDREELPPVFASVSFSAIAARAITAIRRRSGLHGWDAVEYRITRFNGVSRSLAIPHPIAHAQLCLCIHDNWEKLKHITSSAVSRIRPRRHSDGRICIMDYDNVMTKFARTSKQAFGMQYMVHTDISNCFPGIYSHAVPWAAVGFARAKAQRQKKTWFNHLDAVLRSTKRNETQGVPIGPATSNIVSELILQKVDAELIRQRFVFERYIDDYRCFSKTQDKAQNFIRVLSLELSKYKMLLNVKKTTITSLPQPMSDGWTSELGRSMPKSKPVKANEAIHFLELAVTLANREPEGSVLKYAFKTLLRKPLAPSVKTRILPRALELSFHRPELLPLLRHFFVGTKLTGRFNSAEEIHALAVQHALYRRSDAMSWCLYYMNLYAVPIKTRLIDLVRASKDRLSLLMLYKSGPGAARDAAVDFALGLRRSDLYELDQYWMLLYHCFLDGAIPDPYSDEPLFQTLRDNGVSFIL